MITLIRINGKPPLPTHRYAYSDPMLDIWIKHRGCSLRVALQWWPAYQWGYFLTCRVPFLWRFFLQKVDTYTFHPVRVFIYNRSRK